MKKLAWTTLTLFAIASLGAACMVDGAEDEAAIESLDSDDNTVDTDGVWGVRPDGERVWAERICDVHRISDSSFLIGDPLNNRFLVFEEPELGDVALASRDAVTITCDCTEGTGCNPIHAGGKPYCSMEAGCSTCKRSNGARAAAAPAPTGHEPRVSLVPSDTQLTCASDESEWTQAEVDQALAGFVAKIYGDATPPSIESDEAPEGYAWASVRVGDRHAVVLLPMTLLVNIEESRDMRYVIDVPEQASLGSLSAAFSCSCNNPGQTGCKKKSGTGYRMCVSGACTSCSGTFNAH